MKKYIEIATRLSDMIRNNEYKEGEELPNQEVLAREFHTSRVTIRKALDVLDAENLTYSVQGSGTYVKNNAQAVAQWDVRSDLYEGASSAVGEKKTLKSKIIKFNVVFPNEEQQLQLKISKSEPIYDIIRVRLLDDAAVSIEYTIMPVSIIPGISEEVLHKSVYAYIRKGLNKKIGTAYRMISAEKPDEYDMKYIDCDTTTPVMQIEQTVYLENGTIFEHSRTRKRYDKGKYIALETPK